MRCTEIKEVIRVLRTKATVPARIFRIVHHTLPCKSRLGLAWRHNLDGLLDHVESRFFGIGFADR